MRVGGRAVWARLPDGIRGKVQGASLPLPGWNLTRRTIVMLQRTKGFTGGQWQPSHCRRKEGVDDMLPCALHEGAMIIKHGAKGISL